MTTGATIHTTEGLKMTVTRRMPPLTPEMPLLQQQLNATEGEDAALLSQKS